MRDSLARAERAELKPLILLLVYPLAEITAFVMIGSRIGVLATLGLVILSAVMGILVLRRQAASAGQGLRGTLDGMRGAVGTMADGALISLGAILLILPGFVSDLIALPLLIPQARRALIATISKRVTVAQRRSPDRRASADSTIIDGTFYEVDPDAAPKSPSDRPSGWTRH
jgi:UPF0716 protein FxsA